MKINQWLAINKNGITKTRKTKPSLDWDEIAIQLLLEIPDELFRRPIINAKLQVKDVPNNAYNPEIVLNTANLIEQQTGVKVVFTVVADEDTQEKK